MPPNVFLIEDNLTFRETMVFSLGLISELELGGVAESAEEALEMLESRNPDVIIVDGSLPKMSGVEFVRTIKQSHPHFRCLFFSGRNELRLVQDALDAGASGYVVKGATPTELVNAVHLTMEGKCYVSPSVDDWESISSVSSQES